MGASLEKYLLNRLLILLQDFLKSICLVKILISQDFENSEKSSNLQEFVFFSTRIKILESVRNYMYFSKCSILLFQSQGVILADLSSDSSSDSSTPSSALMVDNQRYVPLTCCTQLDGDRRLGSAGDFCAKFSVSSNSRSPKLFSLHVY